VLLHRVFPTLSHTHTHSLSLLLASFSLLSAVVEQLTIIAHFTFRSIARSQIDMHWSNHVLAFLFPELMHGPFIHHTA